MSILSTVLTTTTLTTGLGGMDIPFTVALSSTDGTRAIEFSCDNGVNYFSPAIETTTTETLIVPVLSPITNVRVTGVADDVLTIVDVT